MVLSVHTKIKRIPTKVATVKTSPSTTNFADGIATYQPNDTMKNSQLRLAQDARFDRIGEYGTRKGYKNLSTPIGSTVLITTLSSATSESDIAHLKPYEVSLSGATFSYAIYAIKFRIKKVDDTYAVPRIRILINGQFASATCINPDLITDSYTTITAMFMDAPTISNTDTIKIFVNTQDNKESTYLLETDLNGRAVFELDVCTKGEITNIFEANIDGTKTVLFTFDGNLYRMASNGTITLIRALPAGVKKVRFNQDLNMIRYVDGKEGPRLIDPSNSWADTAITTTDLETGTDLQIKTSNILDGQSDNILYFDADTDTQAVWTYPYGYAYAPAVIYQTTTVLNQTIDSTTTVPFSTMTALTSKTPANAEIGDLMYHGATVGEITAKSGTNYTVKTIDNTAEAINSYDKFDRNFRQNFPAIQTGDPLTAMFNLGGVVYFLTRRNKYQMYAQTADQWSQNQSTAQNGTFSQESVVCDLNYAYFANDTGVYRFNGIDEESLTQNTIQNVYDAIPNKEKIVVDMFNNRLYIYYPSKVGGVNDSCLVYNINLQRWESFDTNSYVSATSARQNASNRFLCGHSKMGMIMLAEENDNDYSDLGQAIAFNLETAYEHFGYTSQLKRIPKWRPEFATTTKPYSVKCGYALDYTDNVKYAFSVDLLDNSIVNESYIWDNPSDYGVPTAPTKLSTIPQINGEFYRCQLRYQHIAAYEPVIFRSHTVTVQIQRIR